MRLNPSFIPVTWFQSEKCQQNNTYFKCQKVTKMSWPKVTLDHIHFGNFRGQRGSNPTRSQELSKKGMRSDHLKLAEA